MQILLAITAFALGHMSPGYMLLVRDTCWLYLGDIITNHLCHGRLVSLCIQQQTGDKLATILSPIQETCWRRQVDTIKWIQLVSGNMCPGLKSPKSVQKFVADHSNLYFWVIVWTMKVLSYYTRLFRRFILSFCWATRLWTPPCWTDPWESFYVCV